MEKDQKAKPVDRKVFSFFMIMFPSVLVVAIAMLAPLLWWAEIGLVVYQSIVLKQFLDQYYVD